MNLPEMMRWVRNLVLGILVVASVAYIILFLLVENGKWPAKRINAVQLTAYYKRAGLVLVILLAVSMLALILLGQSIV